MLFDERLSFKEEISTRVNKANSIAGIIRRSFVYLDEITFCLLFKALVRPHLEYAVNIWNPCLIKDIKAIENVQRRATKQIAGLKDLSYSERLKKLGLPTLKFRRLRGDMIEVYKLLHGLYNCNPNLIIELADNTHTRGHSLKLKKKFARTSRHASVFSNRVVNHWNSLTEFVVTAPTLNAFKNRLDRLWSNHPLKFDWEWVPSHGNLTAVQNADHCDM